MFPLFATGVIDTDGIFAAGIGFAAGVVDTGRGIATGIIDTCGKFSAGGIGGKFAAGVIKLQIFPLIFEKFRNDPKAIIRGLGEDDSRETPEAKNLVTLSLSCFHSKMLMIQ